MPLNQRRFLPEAVESVLGQDGVRLELIVADGGSTDGTQDWLAQRAQEDPRVRWHSQRDGGPAHAINWAMQQARGTVLGWLNSDDRYTPGALLRAVQALDAMPRALMVYGHGRHVDEFGYALDAYPTKPPGTSIAAFADGCFICQPTVVVRRTFLLLNGPLDESLRTAFDFDWWLRAFSRFPGRIGFVDALQRGCSCCTATWDMHRATGSKRGCWRLWHRAKSMAPTMGWCKRCCAKPRPIWMPQPGRS